MAVFDIFFQVIILFFSVILHEVAHGYAAFTLGDPTARDAGRSTGKRALKNDALRGQVVQVGRNHPLCVEAVQRITSLLFGRHKDDVGARWRWHIPLSYKRFLLCALGVLCGRTAKVQGLFQRCALSVDC